MAASRIPRITILLIYFGTLLISMLSFFTTYFGLKIFLNNELALVGSLGLQTAMLGIAWNIIRIRQTRAAYILVFTAAASFSIFFSYVNFNTGLKGNTRAQQACAGYAEASRPVLREHAAVAKQALARGKYQSQRIGDLLQMEESHGWATVVDEGSNDPLVQNIIEGARRTVNSWERTQGHGYRQGSGRGIITNYLTSWRHQIEQNREVLGTYVKTIDSISLLLSSERPVSEQFEMVNFAAVHFPLSAYTQTLVQAPELPEPPFTADYIERPKNGQQALMLVIGDLYPMDRLTFFSLLFAIVIDLIVIAMAIGGSLIFSEQEFVFLRVQRDAQHRIKKMPLDDPGQLNEFLGENIERLRVANTYGQNLGEVFEEFKATRKRLTLARKEETIVSDFWRAGRGVISRLGDRVSSWREKRRSEVTL